MHLCVLGASIHVNVGVREWICLNVRESTCDSVLLGAITHVNVGVREWIWLTTCAAVCVLGANIHVNVGVRD